MTDEPITLVPYDDSWPEEFRRECDVIRGLIAPWLAGDIEHIGSTAVPGLVAKPVIDIMAGVKSLDASRPAIPVLEKIQYCYFPYRPDSMHWFCKPSPSIRTHHLHLVPFESRLWFERLAFRDYLRKHADVAAQYAALKQRLAEAHRFDREAYTDAKQPFIENVLTRSLGSSR